MSRLLSKSKIMAYRQCPKRLWLEVHCPELRTDSATTQLSFQVGHQVGDVAHRIYDPEARGVVLDAQADGYSATFERTRELVTAHQGPIFEAGFFAQ